MLTQICMYVMCICTVQGMQHIHDVKVDLQMTNIHCKSARNRLGRADKYIVKGVVSVLGKQRKRARFEQLITIMTRVQEIQRQEEQVANALHRGDLEAGVILHQSKPNSLSLFLSLLVSFFLS